jgi:hypothetical protein
LVTNGHGPLWQNLGGWAALGNFWAWPLWQYLAGWACSWCQCYHYFFPLYLLYFFSDFITKDLKKIQNKDK